MQVSSSQPGIYTFDSFGPQILTAFSGREFPAARRTEFLNQLGIKEDSLRLVRQVHGRTIIQARKSGIGACVDADGLATARPGICLGILTADCIPAFFWDPSRKAAGLAHAGWRGVHQDILEGMVHYMAREFGSRAVDLQVVFGPAIRACCYEVGPEFAGYFPGFYRPPADAGGKGRMDLAAAAADRLVRAGVPGTRIEDTGICTACRIKDFFSARREKTPERILSIIQIRP